MLIKIPSSFEAWTLTWLIVISMFIGMVTVTYFYIRRKMKRKYLLAKIEPVAPLVRGVRAELAAGGRVQGYVGS